MHAPGLPPLPETLADRLRCLPSKWMQGYVLALMELGGEPALANSRCRVSGRSVDRYKAECPDFAAACKEAVIHSTGTMKAAVYQSATVGDLKPIYRGPFLVGYERVKSVKAAELILKVRGELGNGAGSSGTVPRGTATAVPTVPLEDLPALLASVAGALFGGHKGRPKTLDAATGEEVTGK